MRPPGKPLLKRIWNYRVIDLMLLPTILYFVLFKCRAVWGMKLAFFDYRPRGEDMWAGLKHFRQVFSSLTFGAILLNAVKISPMRTLLNWFFPMVFPLLQHKVRCSSFRKAVRVVSYLPHFLSRVVIYGIRKDVLDYGGMLNGLDSLLELADKNLLLRSDTIVGASVGTPSSIWQRFSPSTLPCLTPPPRTACCMPTSPPKTGRAWRTPYAPARWPASP